MFVFFSSRLGFVGSLLVTVVMSAILLLMRGCSTGPGTAFSRGASGGEEGKRCCAPTAQASQRFYPNRI